MNGKSFEQQKINLRKAVISNVLQQEKKNQKPQQPGVYTPLQ